MVVIRSARVEDAAALSQLVAISFEPYIDRIGARPGPMSTDYEQLIPTGTVWVAEHGGETVGTIVLTAHPDHLLLDNLAVSPTARRLGIGSALLDFAAEHARSVGLGELRLYTNERMTENLEFYPRRGFRETRRATVDGFRRVFFSRTL
jgi:ribosomal protein S18 acetylase RimI-like enzyme